MPDDDGEIMMSRDSLLFSECLSMICQKPNVLLLQKHKVRPVQGILRCDRFSLLLIGWFPTTYSRHPAAVEVRPLAHYGSSACGNEYYYHIQ